MSEDSLKISFFCIARDEEVSIGRMLDTVVDYVDEIVVVDTGSKDKTVEIADSYGAKIAHFEWIDDFAAARNFAMEQCTHNIIFWLDCDDSLRNGEILREVTEELFKDPRNGGGFMIYDYAKDDYGNSVMEHWKLRLFRKDKFVWKGEVHEDPCFVWDCGRKKVKDIWVEHHKKIGDIKGASERNLRILLKNYNRDTDNPDPRTLFYLGNTYLGLREDKKAIEFFERHFETSGWNEERYVGLTRITDIHIRNENYNVAIDTCLRAIKLVPEWPDAYFMIAQCYLSLNNYERVEEWTSIGFNRIKQNGTPDAQVLINPRRYDLYPMLVLEDAYIQQGKFREAVPVIQKILQFMPTNESYKARLQHCMDVLRENEVIGAIRFLKETLEEEKDNEKLYNLANALPKFAEDMPSMLRLKNIKNSKDGKKDIAIFCGPCHELWSPLDVKTGIGGSEEAVINISKELTALGWNVTVYSFLPEGLDGEYDGVLYKNYWEVYGDLDKEWHTVILWRSPGYLQGDWKCKNIYLWLHDMQEQNFYNSDLIDRVDKIFVLSEFHRKNIHFIPDEKVCITANGIDASHFDRNIERQPYKVIYSSSPDRGLDVVLDSWEDIRAEVPDAELHIYYGFTPVYDSLYHNNPKMLGFKKTIMSKIESLKDKGVVYHGRVGHQELADAMLSSEVWAYPTSFPEISCITGMKTQAAGCIPVCSSYAALDETVQHGYKLDTPVDEPVMTQDEWREKFKNAMITALNDREAQESIRNEMVPWAREHYTWQRVAKQWSELFEGVEVGQPN